MRDKFENLMTTAEVADAYGVSTARIRRMAIDGLLPFQRSPLGRLYPRTQIEQLVAARKEQRQKEARKRGGGRARR